MLFGDSPHRRFRSTETLDSALNFKFRSWNRVQHSTVDVEDWYLVTSQHPVAELSLLARYLLYHIVLNTNSHNSKIIMPLYHLACSAVRVQISKTSMKYCDCLMIMLVLYCDAVRKREIPLWIVSLLIPVYYILVTELFDSYSLGPFCMISVTSWDKQLRYWA